MAKKSNKSLREGTIKIPKEITNGKAASIRITKANRRGK